MRSGLRSALILLSQRAAQALLTTLDQSTHGMLLKHSPPQSALIPGTKFVTAASIMLLSLAPSTTCSVPSNSINLIVAISPLEILMSKRQLNIFFKSKFTSDSCSGSAFSP